MTMLSLADESQFEHLLMYAAYAGGVVVLLSAFVISDDEDADGEGGISLSGLLDKAKTLAAGVLYSRTGALYIILLTVYTVVLVLCLFKANLTSEDGTKALLALVGLNLVLPVATYFMLD